MATMTLSDMRFESYSAKYAVEITSSGTYTFDNCYFDKSGTYAFEIDSGVTGDTTIILQDGSTYLTASDVDNNGSGSVTVQNPRTVLLTVTTTAGVAIQNANTFVRTSDGAGPFPYEDSVTIVNAAATATVTHTAHGMATGDKVLIEGASHDENNGVFTITYINANSYSYTMGSSPGSSPTGSITSTFVFLKGLTDVNGEIEMTRDIPSSQNVTGWSAKASGSPYYKNGIVNGTVSSLSDTNFSAVMASDE